jgi:hypothetical protein
MKPRLALVLLALSAIAGPTLTRSQPYPPHTLPNTELRVLPPTADGRHYQLHVHLPGSYAGADERRYPVLYVTDGYWDFPTMVATYNNLVYDRVVPECIIVGLGYAGEGLDYGRLRTWELSPVPVRDAPDSGHADRFLQTLGNDIIPFIEREYRADPGYRVLAGSSLGGLFTLFTMWTQPELFQAYVAASPATLLQDGWLFDLEKRFAQSGRPLPARLYMTGAEHEWPTFLGGIVRLHETLAGRSYPKWTYEYRRIDGERHAGTKAESYTRGLRFALAPLAPETGPSRDP